MRITWSVLVMCLFGGVAFGFGYYLKDKETVLEVVSLRVSDGVDQEAESFPEEEDETDPVYRKTKKDSDVDIVDEDEVGTETDDQSNDDQSSDEESTGGASSDSSSTSSTPVPTPTPTPTPTSTPTPTPTPTPTSTPVPTPITSRIEVTVYYYTPRRQYPAQHTHVTIVNQETGALIDSGDTSNDGVWNSGVRVDANTEIVVTATDYGVSKQLNTGPYGTMQAITLNAG
jgi:hypothetical protein